MEGCIALPLLISAGGRPNVFVMSDTSWGVGGDLASQVSCDTALGEYVNALAGDQCSITLLQRDLRYAICYREIVGSCIV